MKAWQLDYPGGPFNLNDIPAPEARAGSVVIRMHASSLMSYMRDYVEGRLPVYRAPDKRFTPGGNGTGVIYSVGENVWHLKPGQRVVISPHFVTNENVSSPGQILLGVTGQGDVAGRMLNDWPDGTLAEFAVLPASLVTPADGLDFMSDAQLAMSMRFTVPYGGLLRGQFSAGETLVVSGATGAYGAAAVLLALAMGARRVVAVGRNAARLDALVKIAGPRVVPVVVTGSMDTDTRLIREQADGAVDMVFDMVGNAGDPAMTLSSLRSLRHGGRMILMGSMSVPLPLSYTELMLNSWAIIGNFMYPPEAYRQVLNFFRAGLIPPDAITALNYGLDNVPAAMDAARQATGLQCVVINHQE
ncbi:zinc-binding dehydrogenase [Pantoea cypripedii]|uniref:Alcohol dehydrogenase n=1 Tax=Pantoea cypripedii TaxID=55209 RepID=A0A6B9G463_PANCY|nr:zinc-binding dehydrogenase [Pantoea cypripedii]QGY32451.1 alcohol dehydrogenase [Pantoea cypripedii]